MLFIINYFEYAKNLICGYLEIMQLSLIQNKIYEIRGMNVMLDFDLAEMYSVETKVLKQSVKRNQNRFPPDFMFSLTQKEFQSLRSQIVTSKTFVEKLEVANCVLQS